MRILKTTAKWVVMVLVGLVELWAVGPFLWTGWTMHQVEDLVER